MFKSKNECNIVYKCTVRLLDDSDVLECEFQVCKRSVLNKIYTYLYLNMSNKNFVAALFCCCTHTYTSCVWMCVNNVELPRGLLPYMGNVSTEICKFRKGFGQILFCCVLRKEYCDSNWVLTQNGAEIKLKFILFILLYHFSHFKKAFI